MPPGPRQVASAVTGDATQIHIAERANKRPVRYLLADLRATGFSDWTRSAGRSCRRMLLVPVIGRSGAGVGTTLRVESD
jgi:hypothetical protein